jgi:NCS1 family nucleobase:cation symporter-1
MATNAAAHQEARVRIEQHSIDYVPESDRHGQPWQQLPFWFAGGCGLTSAAIGFIGPSLGLDLVWSLVAVVLGMAFGTIFMALHANQGPRLGIPQMIQSRAQFGHRGAVIPLVLAVLIYMSLTVFTALFTRSAFNDAFNVNVGSWFYLIFIALVALIAIGGFDWVHVLNRWGGYLSLLVFVIMNVLLVMYTNGHKELPSSISGFSWAPFLIQFAAAAGYQIA